MFETRLKHDRCHCFGLLRAAPASCGLPDFVPKPENIAPNVLNLVLDAPAPKNVQNLSNTPK
jgi:hypothetical protein